MELVKKELASLLSQDVDIQDEKVQQDYPQVIVDAIMTNEDLFPKEKADKYIWWINFAEKEKAYWETKSEYAKKNAEALEKMVERSKTYLRFLMVDDEIFYGTDQKIEPFDYKKSVIDESLLTREEFTYSIEGLSFDEFDAIMKMIVQNTQLFLTCSNNTKRKPFGVTKLGEDHPAVLKNIKRSVRIKNLTQKELKNA